MIATIYIPATLPNLKVEPDNELIKAVAENDLSLVEDVLINKDLLFAQKTKSALNVAAQNKNNTNSEMLKLLLQHGAAIGQSLDCTLPAENALLDYQIVIGLKIQGKPVTRKIPGYENAITNIEELIQYQDKITNHFLLIKACTLYLENNLNNAEIKLLKQKLMLISTKSLRYRCLMFILQHPKLAKSFSKEYKELKEPVFEEMKAVLRLEMNGPAYQPHHRCFIL